MKKLRGSLLVIDLDLVFFNAFGGFLWVLVVVVSEFIFLELEMRKLLAILGPFGRERFLCVNESPDRLLPGLLVVAMPHLLG